MFGDTPVSKTKVADLVNHDAVLTRNLLRLHRAAQPKGTVTASLLALAQAGCVGIESREVAPSGRIFGKSRGLKGLFGGNCRGVDIRCERLMVLHVLEVGNLTMIGAEDLVEGRHCTLP